MQQNSYYKQFKIRQIQNLFSKWKENQVLGMNLLAYLFKNDHRLLLIQLQK